MAGASPAHAQAVNLGGGNNIVADGRTQTHVTVQGAKTSITTDTVSRGTGFNSFSDFQQAAGTQVDLYVPDGAGNLLNIVHNGPVVIDGILNGYKGGQIGGNIYFSDSHGFVVGSNGVVNVGSLTVNTPTSQFLENVVLPDGTVNDAAADQLMQGAIPISPDGSISIAGTINAKGNITLQGHDVDVTGGHISIDDAPNHVAIFKSTVNTGGVSEGGRLVSQGGEIRIVATDQARLGGTIKTSAPKTGGQGGKIAVNAGNITIDGMARLTADGEVEGGGGTIDVVAADKLLVEDGALFSARGAGSGMGGFVELSGKLAQIGSIDVSLGSDRGAAGTLLFDPWDLYIGGTLTDSDASGDYSSAPNIVTHGANVLLQADNSITVSSGGKIDTTSATGDAGTIRLESRLITIADNATLDAQATGIHAAGDIFLIASATGTALSPTAVSGITIGSVGGTGPTISGKNVTFAATSEIGSGLALVDVPDAEATIGVNGGTIDATGAFTATATASIESSIGFLPVGVVVTNLNAAVNVSGNAQITADSANLSALATVVSEIQTMSLAPPGTPVDGAVAVSTVDSNATVGIAGDASFNVAHALELDTKNDITLIANATPATAALGISVAVGVIDATTTAEVGGNASVSTDSLVVNATTTTAATVTAAASEGGGGAPQQGDLAKSILDDDRYKPGTTTSEGSVSAVGGFAITDLTSTTLAKIDSTSSVTATGDVSLAAKTSNSAETTADGSAVDSKTGVGVAVAFNLAHVSNDAIVDGPLHAGALDITAGMLAPDGKNSFTATATSGAGASNVGVAGSLATNLVDTESVAGIGGNGAVTLSGAAADASIEAADITETSAKATPSAPASGDKAGIGASAALNIVANRSTAELAKDATLTGARNVTLSAEGEFTAEAEAEAGAEGGISLTPALGLSLINNSTTAQLGTGGTLVATGKVDLSAIQQADTTTKASGKAVGSKAAIGAALALAIVNDQVVATTNRSITTTGTGNVDFLAMGASFSSLEAEASATGGEESKDDGSAPADDQDVDGKVDAQFTDAEGKQTKGGVGDSTQKDKTASDVGDKDGRSASTSEGKVSVAAAVGVNVQTASVSATVPDTRVITAGGTLTLGTAANTDGSVTANGSAVGEDGAAQSKVGIGVGVAVNKIAASNIAQLGAAAHTLGGLRIEATKTDIAAKLANPTSTAMHTDAILASATSGAGASKVGIAGSLALNLIDSESTARIADGSTVTITGSKAVNLSAAGAGMVTATAAPTENGGASGDSVGVGVSAAINIVANRSTAELAKDSDLTGADAVTLHASGDFTTKADAKAGSAGGISVTPALGLNLVSNSTTAQLGEGTTFHAGSLDVSATQLASTITKASGEAAGSKAAVGVALALALVNDDVVATTSRDLDIDNAVSFTAMGASSSEIEATASASGGEAAKDDGSNQAGDKDVDGKVDDQLGTAQSKQTDSKVGDSAQKSKTASDVNDKDGRSASTSEGKVSVAAAVGVNVQTATVSATIPDTVAVTAGGTLTLGTAANTDGSVSADGSAVGKEGAQASQVGIGAAVAVNKVAASNVARLGDNTHSLGGLTIEALKTDVAKQLATPSVVATRDDDFSTTAKSGAGASKVGIAGSLALNLIDTESSARIAGGANVTITGTGAVSLSAEGSGGVTATAAPTDEGGATGDKAGIGVSAAVNVLANRAIAELENDVVLSGVGALTLSASGTFAATADATAGSAGGVSLTPALGLNLVSNSTTAQLGTGGLLTAGSVDISATQEATTTTKAWADAKGGTAAIGVALALALVNDDVVATTSRSITTTGSGAVTFTAMGKSEGTLEAKAGASGAKAADDNGEAQAGDKDVDTKVNDQLDTAQTKQTDSKVGDSTQKGETGTAVGDKSSRSAKTSEGKVAVAAAVSVDVQKSSVTAVVPDAVVITAGGKLTIESGNTTGANTSADGSAVGENGSSSGAQVGIGVGVAINVVSKTNIASLGNGSHSADGVEITARQFGDPLAPDVDDYETTATSGAGGSKVGVAGSLALNLINATTTAHILGDIDAHSGASSISADQRITAKATAAPSGNGANGGKVGIGASVALNLITDSVTAELPNGVTYSHGGGLAVSANSVLNTTTEAEAGAGGGVAVDAVVALATLDQTTTARIGSGAAIDTAGAVTIEATSSGDQEASAKGDTKAASVGVGAAAAIIMGGGTQVGALWNTSVTSAELARDVTAASLDISAEADHGYTADATATAKGGKEDTTTTQSGGKATSADALDKTKGSQQGASGGGKVTVAAAVGVAAAQDVVSARLDAVTVHVTGDLKVDASNNTGMAASGSGLAVNSSSKVGVGIGVGLGIINNTTSATIADNARITQSGSVEVKTTTAENTDPDFADKLTALAIAGASASKVSVAGALAVGISTSSSTAAIGDNVTVSSSGAVNVLADNTSKLSAKALAGSYSGGNVGIGASVATVYADHSLTAAIGAGDTIGGASVSVKALDHKFTGTGFSLDFTHPDTLVDQAKDAAQHGSLLGQGNYYAEAMGGAAAGSGVAVQGSFAVMVFSDDVSASIGKSLATTPVTTATTVNSSGAVAIEAGNDLVARALSGGIALGSSVGVGVSSSAIDSTGTTTALLAQNAEVQSSASFSDAAHATQDILAIGVSAAAADSNAVAGVATVITSANSVQALLALNSSVTSAGSVTLGARNDFDTFSIAGGAAGGGSNGIGAAASVITVDNVTRAALADGTGTGDAVVIDAGGAVAISADATETGTTLTAAGAAAGEVAVGAGAAVYVLDTTTEALVGKYAKIGQSTTIRPASLGLEASDDTDLTTIAGALAGGGTAGAGAGVAVGVVGKTTSARIGDDAAIFAGDVSVVASSSESALTTAVGVGIGGTAGLAGAVSVYSVTDVTTAEIGDAAVWSNGNAAVLAGDDVAIDFISGAAGISGTAAVGAAASVALVTTTTHALIDDNASVTALGNGTAVDYVTGYAPSLGSGSGDYAAPTPTDYAYATTGADGEVLSADDAQRQGLRLLALTRSATPITASGYGVVVNASGDTSVRSLAIGAGVSGTAGISISANVPVIDTDIAASIGANTKINVDNDTSPNANQSVIVAAAGDVYRAGLSGSVGGGTVGIGGGLETAILSPTITASIGNSSTVNAKRDVIVSASGHEDIVGAAAAAGAGVTVGVSGGVTAFALNSHTHAGIGNGATVTAGGNVVVAADDVTRTGMVVGSLAIGATGGGVGGSLGLSLLTKNTNATIADTASVTALGGGSALTPWSGADFSATQAAQGVIVTANSNESVFTLSIAGAGGLFAGIAGAVSVQLLDITTTAAIGDATINGDNTGANSAQDVVVVARDSTSVAAIDGGLAIGAVGLAGAVDVGVLRNTTAASIANGATVNGKDRVEVAGLQQTDVDSTVVSAAGGIVGIAAGVSVYSIGDGIDPNSKGNAELQSGGSNPGDYAQGQLGNSTVNDLLASSDDTRINDIGTRMAAARAGVNVASLNTQASTPAGTSASIGNAAVTAGGAVTVASLDTLGTDATTGAVGVGLGGLGAGVGVVVVDTTNTAQVTGSSTLGAGSLAVTATTTHTLDTHSLAAAFGALGAEASIAILIDNATTTASIDGMTIATSGAVVVLATDQRTANTKADGASFGGVAVGVSAAAVNLGGSVTASLHNASIGTSGSRAGSVTVSASSRNSAKTSALAASGGLGLAAQGSDAEANTTTLVSALADGATIYASGAVSIAGSAAGRASADATGFALAGIVAAGGSFAHANVAEQVATTVGGHSLIDAGSISIAAAVTPDTTTPAVDASATGSSGAMVGLTATESKATNSSSAKTLAENSTLTASGLVAVTATTATSQHASASGFAGGLLAAGANVAQADSTIVTTALFSDMTGVTGGNVDLHATGTDTNVADAVSGSGGLIAGAAADASTNSVSTTRAAANTSSSAAKYLISALGGTVDVAATHTANFGGSVDSTQASLVGASGASIEHAVTATVDAHLGDNTWLLATNLAVAAHNLIHNYFINEPTGSTSFNPDNGGWNVDSGSGGLVNLPAGSVTVELTQNTSAAIGTNADVHLVAPTSGVSSLSLEAYNDTVSHQKVKLDSGGAIALAETYGEITSTANAAVSVGDTGSIIVDIGDVALAAWGDADLGARAAATTYGLAGAPSGRAYATYTGNNTVTLGQNVRLEASDGIDPTDGSLPSSGTVSLSAGTGLDGTPQSLRLATTVDLYNKTAIPISTTPDARSTVHSNPGVTVGADPATYPDSSGAYGVNAAGDIMLRANRGNIDATAVGTGKDIYREELAKAASAVSNLFGGGDVTFDYHGGTVTKDGQAVVTINGLVDTGLQRHKVITFDYAPNCDTLTAACLASTAAYNIKYTTSGPKTVGTEIVQRVAELNKLLSQYSSDPVAAGAYRSEITFLQKKLVALGLGTFDSNGNFVAGTYAGPSPRDAALANVADTQTQISTANTNLVMSTSVADPGSVTLSASLVSAYSDATHGLVASANAAKDSVSSNANFSKYYDAKKGNGDDNPDYDATFHNAYDALVAAISAGQTAANAVQTYISGAPNDTTSNAYHQGQIDSLVAQIQSLETDLANALLSNDGTASTIATSIGNKQTQLAAEITAINNNNSAIATQSAAASSNAALVSQDLTTLYNKLGLSTTGLDAVRSAVSGVTPQGDPANGHQPGIADYNSSLQSALTASSTKITALTGSGSGSVSAQVTGLNTLASTLATQTAAAATAATSNGSPTAYSIDVADTAARLGNISIVADQLNGAATGALKAYGDAAISITNNTANTLTLGNLLIPDYDAGNVRFNGALVTSSGDINALNASGSGANFGPGSVVTGATSSRPQVTIVSNYNPDSTTYYDPHSTDQRYNASHLPPDIILKSGKAIDNLTGAVNITSAAGNIYVQGVINAGSVSILAKNGDFVSSYVNGFDHIGGDPASFNDPTRAQEAGKGITANGAISIAARYLNINSTIQSGIADWTLDLDGTEKLTLSIADAAAIGLNSGDVQAKLDAFKTAVQAATDSTSTPSPLIDLGTDSGGRHIYLNMAPEGVDTADLKDKIAAYVAGVHAGGSLPNPVVAVKLAADSTKTVTVNIKDFLSDQVTGRIEFSMATADAYAAANTSARAVYSVISPTSNIGVSYDARHAQYEVDGTSVHGGSIQLYGQIMNTASSGGQLNVLDGFGTIDIANSSAIPVVLATLKTGDDPTGSGRGTAGVIDIMDITGVNVSNPATPVVSATHTIYTRDYDPLTPNSGQVKKQAQSGFIDSQTGNFVDGAGHVLDTTLVAKVWDGTDRNTSYATTAGQRYVWTTGDYYEASTDFETGGTRLFGSDDLTVNSFTNLTATSGPTQTAHVRLDDGTYMTLAGDMTRTGNDTVYRSGSTAGIIIVPADQSVSSIPNTDSSILPFETSTHSFLTLNDLEPNGSSSSCVWWTACIASDYTYYYKLTQHYTTITTNSLKADNPIGINFIGSDTGAITVNSSSDVVLTNSVSANNGTVSIKTTGTGSIIEGNLAGQIVARSADLEAAGSVGGVTWTADPSAPTAAAIAVTLDGPLTAKAANGDVDITSRSDLKVATITAARTTGTAAVNLTTSKSISGVDANARIEAPRVTLTALNGSVGSTADGQQLLVNTGFLYGDTTRAFGNPAITNPTLGLSVTAGGDIGIKSSIWSGNADGTMLLDQVLSLGGDVRLVSTGQILDNNPNETIDQRTYAQLLSYWNTLGLLNDPNSTNDANDLKQAATIKAYENSRTQAYDQYWQIRRLQADGGTTYDASFQYTLDPSSAQYTALSQQFDAQVRAANPGYTDTQVAAAVTQKLGDFVDGQTELYHDLNAEVGALTTSYDPGYRYHASDTEKTSLTDGAVWTDRELAFSLTPGALKTVTATNPVIKDPNVSGRKVTLEAQTSVGETIGAGTPTPGIRIAADIAPSALTLDQKVALASAERSDLQLDVVYHGVTQHIPLGADYTTLTPDQQAALDAAAAHTLPTSDITIVVLSKRPLNFNATGSLNVTVADAPDTTLDKGDAYLASRQDGLLGNITVPGETRIKVLGNIANALSSHLATGNLVLEAAQGSIGTAITPLQLGLNTNATLTARAQGGVNLDFTGDARIDTVYSPQDVNLDTDSSLLNANSDQLINILGTNVRLHAQGTIGSAARALNVGNNQGGGITASAGGLINLYGPSNSLFVVKSAASQAASITLTAGFEGILDGSADAPGRVTLNAGGRFIISGTSTVHSTAGDVLVDAGSLKMINGAAITADIGRVLIDTDGDALVTGITSGSTNPYAVDITAGGHVIAATDPDRAYDIKAMSAGAGVRITAALGIGDLTEADDKWADGPSDPAGGANAITSVGNALRILSSSVTLDAAAGDIYADLLAPDVTLNLKAGSGNVYIEAAGKLNIGDLQVKRELTLGVNELSGHITQVPPGPDPLRLSITGYHGGIGTSANLVVDAPSGLIMPILRFYDSQIETTAKSVAILSAYVPGSLRLTTPFQTLWVDDRSPRPTPGSNAQMYQPDYAFSLDLDTYHTTTNAFVVWYDPTAQITNLLNGLPVDGASLVRDTVRLMTHNDPLQVLLIVTVGPDGEPVQHEFFFDEKGHRVVIDGVVYPVGVVGDGPAVQLSEAN
ncbi:MAG: hypothetical protein BGO82_13335 [Devosia sp. 67-54]|nr:MAG: hypothetical protein BGO82_13335 [Devosia sp. 67-54]